MDISQILGGDMKNIEEWKRVLNEIKDLRKTFSSHET